ncbi:MULTISPECIES: hypothetical protein [unclassified Pseudarthrobacter]|uniref:hypothetical protein n=1 Tax=unclassified Pseudarthrobacter TaxID=2647000 RepID=UPI003076B6C2
MVLATETFEGVSKNSRWARFGLVASGAVCALVVAISVAGFPRPTSEPIELTQADAAERVLNCKHATYFVDDIAYYDSMNGLSCFLGDGEAVHIRVYEAEGSALVVLQDWEHILSPERQVIHTDKWFAVGPPLQLEKIKARFRTFDGPSAFVPESPRITPRQPLMGDCSFFLTSSIVDAAVNPTQYSATISFLDQKFLGSKDLIESIVDSTVVEQVKKRQRGHHMELDQYLSGFSSRIKPFCASKVP